MEIADVFVVNKADRPGADRLRTDIELMLGLRKGAHFRNMPAHHGVDLKKIANPVRLARESAGENPEDGWTPPVLSSIAAKGEGINAILDSLDAHFTYLEKSGSLRDRRRARLRERIVDAVEQKMRGRLWTNPDVNNWLDTELGELEAGKETPYGAADRLLKERGELVTRAKP
jgi:LAO/AO transport system kinase